MTPPNQSKPEVPEIKRKECNDDLENAAERHTDNGNHVPHGKRDMPSWVYSRLDFKAGAEWQKAKDAKRLSDLEDSKREHLELLKNREGEIKTLKSFCAHYETKLAKVREQTLMEVIDFLKTDLMSASSGGTWARVIKSQFLPKREENE